MARLVDGSGQVREERSVDLTKMTGKPEGAIGASCCRPRWTGRCRTEPARDARAEMKNASRVRGVLTGAGNETRTRDLNLGKVALYQLSYSRKIRRICYRNRR